MWNPLEAARLDIADFFTQEKKSLMKDLLNMNYSCLSPLPRITVLQRYYILSESFGFLHTSSSITSMAIAKQRCL